MGLLEKILDKLKLQNLVLFGMLIFALKLNTPVVSELHFVDVQSYHVHVCTCLGNMQQSTFTSDHLTTDTRGRYLKSNLDHFEKFVGILKVPTGTSPINETETGETKAKRARVSLLEGLLRDAAVKRNWRAVRMDLVVSPASQFYYALVGWTVGKLFNR